MVVGCWLEKERKAYAGKKEGMEEEPEAKGTLLTFLESRGVVRQPRLHQHPCVRGCVHALFCVFSRFSIQ